MAKETLKQTADKLFASTSHTKLWANPKGEFFTSENIAKLSLKKGQSLSEFQKSGKVVQEVTTDNPEETNI